MSIDRYADHVFVIPEDDANRQIANGFCLDLSVRDRAIKILSPPGGWSAVVKDFLRNHVKDMRSFPKRRMVLLIDFDDAMDRADKIMEEIPEDLRPRVYILGVGSEPEKLKKAFAFRTSFEDIGRSLAQECFENSRVLWSIELLKHNAANLERLEQDVKPFLIEPR